MKIMAEDIEQVINVLKKPYFVIEGDRGRFYIVNSITILGKEGWKYNADSENSLEEGLDLREIPTRGLNLLVKADNYYSMDKIVEQLRDFAFLTASDYFGVEGNVKYVNRTNNPYILYAKPRLFRKLINN